MKKIGKFLFTFLFLMVSLTNVQNVDAANDEIRFDTAGYDYYVTGTNKLKMKVYGEPGDGPNIESNVVKKAIQAYYPENLTSGIVDVIPFSFTVEDGQIWNQDTDTATMYINIPKIFGYDNSNAESIHIDGESIHIVRFKEVDGEMQTYSYDINGATRSYEIKEYDSIKSIITSDAVTSAGTADLSFGDGTTNYFTDQFAVLTTNEFNSTGTTYYMLITRRGEKSTPTQPTPDPTKPSEPTTTVDNPKTGDANSQLYILVGTIGLIGIVGLGLKFAKAK